MQDLNEDGDPLWVCAPCWDRDKSQGLIWHEFRGTQHRWWCQICGWATEWSDQ